MYWRQAEARRERSAPGGSDQDGGEYNVIVHWVAAVAWW
jgi:hypothetical protein